MEEVAAVVRAAASTTHKTIREFFDFPHVMSKDISRQPLDKKVEDVDALLKRLEEMEARTKRLEEALEVIQQDMYDSYCVHDTTLQAVRIEHERRKGMVRDLRALERRVDEALPCAKLLSRLVKLS